MELLKKFIKKTLNEARQEASNIPENIFLHIEEDNKDIFIHLSDKDGLENIGGIEIAPPPHNGSDCSNSWIVISSSAIKGWGPFLYDVAIEWATLFGNGLKADPDSLSKQAFNVWQKYYDQRPDVNHNQLDDLTNILTKTHQDNCDQQTTYKHSDEKDSKKALLKSPISKSYTKAPTTLNTLLKLGKLRDTTGYLNT